MSRMISANVPDNLAMMFEIFVRETKESESFHIQKALESYLEDHADLKTARDRLRDPSDPVISAEEMRRRLGI